MAAGRSTRSPEGLIDVMLIYETLRLWLEGLFRKKKQM